MLTEKDVFQPCGGCGASKFVIEREDGDIVCKNCGLVVCDHILDSSSEWKTYEDEGVSKGVDRTTKLSEAQIANDVQSTFLVGGKSKSERAMLSKLHVDSSLTKQELKYVRNSETVKTMCHRLQLQDQIMVS